MTESCSGNADRQSDGLSASLKGVNLYLVGMMGSGKTTVGRIVAKRLGYHFFDTDALVEQVAGQSVSDIFAASGEAAFRQLETQVLARLVAHKKLVVATGGGIVVDRQNWSYLHHGIVVWLDVPIALLCDRLRDSTTRPLLQNEPLQHKLETLLEQRQHFYAQADVQVRLSAAETPNRAASQLMEAVRRALKPPTLPPADATDATNMFN
jgi:shikimate kinase